jgi:hypothetical protein
MEPPLIPPFPDAEDMPSDGALRGPLDDAALPVPPTPPKRPPSPDGTVTAMDLADGLCGGIAGLSSPMCRGWVFNVALYGDMSREEIEKAVERRFK